MRKIPHTFFNLQNASFHYHQFTLILKKKNFFKKIFFKKTFLICVLFLLVVDAVASRNVLFLNMVRILKS